MFNQLGAIKLQILIKLCNINNNNNIVVLSVRTDWNCTNFKRGRVAKEKIKGIICN